MAEQKPTVLLIEDDPFMTTLLYEYLVKDGFEVISAEDGEEAVKQFKKSTPDVMLIDIFLPKKNGLEALREIRALPGGADVPAMILSNLEEVSYQKEADALGVKAYLIKANVQLPEIVAKVKEVLRK